MLPDAFWLGGGGGAGKTTAARRIAFARDLRLYCVDHYGYDHQRRAAPGSRTAAFEAMTYDERWHRDPAGLAGDFVAISRERFDLMLADLDALGPGPAVIVEGPQLLPDLVAPLLPSPAYACWLLPAPDVAAAGVESRDEAVPPGRVARDRLLVELIRRDAAALGLRTVADRNVLVPPDLRGAVDGAQRRRIRAAENAVALAQLRAYAADADLAEPPVHTFSCECERLGCGRDVLLTADAYERSGADAH
ncbi:MAG: hypothetical protein QOE45_1933 [Frankiaceae bacterium]|nr:hypothetical protein [Frankiaceae bacterium]